MKKIISILIAIPVFCPNIATGLQVNNTTLRPPMSCNVTLRPTETSRTPLGCEGLASILKQIRNNYRLASSQQTDEKRVECWQLAKEGLVQLRGEVLAAREKEEFSDDKKVWLFTKLLEFSEAESPDFLNGLALAMFAVFIVDYNLPIAYLSHKIPDSSRLTYYLFLVAEHFERAFETTHPEFSVAIAEQLQELLHKSQWPSTLTNRDIGEAIQARSHEQLMAILVQAGDYYLTTPPVQHAFKLYYPELSPTDFNDKLQDAFIRAIKAFAIVPRQLFLPRFAKPWAGYDTPLIIPHGHQQTISQPSFVYMITALANPIQTDRVCEIGVGSGYQTAVLAKQVNRVVAVDIYPDLVAGAAQATSCLGLRNIDFFVGDGSQGLPKQGPFDIIVVSAGGTEAAAQALEKQLTMGGRLIMPIISPKPNRDPPYDLMLRVRTAFGITQIPIATSAWVPLVGAKGWGKIGIEKGAYLRNPRRFSAQVSQGL